MLAKPDQNEIFFVGEWPKSFGWAGHRPHHEAWQRATSHRPVAFDGRPEAQGYALAALAARSLTLWCGA
jgi:hypothetical protein